MLSEIVILILVFSIGGLLYEQKRLEKRLFNAEAAIGESAEAFVEIGAVLGAMLETLPKDVVEQMNEKYKSIKQITNDILRK